MNRYAKFLALGLVLATSGCANLNSAFRTSHLTDGKSAFVDIKQRAIITSHSQHKGTVVCAEPSPDSMSAYAAEIAASTKDPRLKADIASSFREGSSFVGLRTQSIQLLRDSLYRLCEGYMSGALDQGQYDLLMRNYQRNMVALLAIEQLTGAIHPPAVTLAAGSHAGTSAADIVALRKELAAIDAELSATRSAIEAAGEDDQEAIKGLEEKLGELTRDRQALRKRIENPAAGVHAGGSFAVSEAAYTAQAKTFDDATDAVERIVMRILDGDESVATCINYLAGWHDQGAVAKYCDTVLENAATRKREETSRLARELEQSLLKSQAATDSLATSLLLRERALERATSQLEAMKDANQKLSAELQATLKAASSGGDGSAGQAPPADAPGEQGR